MAEYRIPEAVLPSHLGDETVLLHLETKQYFRLNATAAHIFRGMQRGLSIARLADDLCGEFEVTPEGARAEVDRLLRELSARQLVSLDAATL